jgi:hypothetical protein
VLEVQTHQMRRFTSNMLDFLFKLDLIFITTGSSETRVGKVQTHQTRQFTSDMLPILFKLELILPLWVVHEHEYGKATELWPVAGPAPRPVPATYSPASARSPVLASTPAPPSSRVARQGRRSRVPREEGLARARCRTWGRSSGLQRSLVATPFTVHGSRLGPFPFPLFFSIFGS